jgi:hypothetical protein
MVMKSSPRRLARPAQSPSNASRPKSPEIVSELRRLVRRADGTVLNAPAAGDQGGTVGLLAEIPGANFRFFLAGLRRLGAVEFNEAKEPVPAPNARLRVEISLGSK